MTMKSPIGRVMSARRIEKVLDLGIEAEHFRHPYPPIMTRGFTTFFAPLLAVGLSAASATAAVTIDWLIVGFSGNAADSTGYGAVAYDYSIGKYEVTNSQYTAFLNAVDPAGANANGIWNSSMGSDARGGISFNSSAASGSKYTVKTNMAEKPVNYVSWYDSARFINWLHNGQGAGSTEAGAYTLSGNTGSIIKNSGATVWLPSENEWYKAAYYDPTPGAGGGDNYWSYAIRSNTAPTFGTATATGSIANPGANVVNGGSNADWNGQNGNVVTVGSGGANNYFGTADMNGNVWERNDAVVSSTNRAIRGGAWDDSGSNMISSARVTNMSSTVENEYVGFRVAGLAAASAVPEPSAVMSTLILMGSAFTIRRRSPR